ncbi:hypothetical protein C8F01DRAFT_985847 [Mycena amicta]|nr:hypothetical protein C8F01DRAFT_985847 [Mycena amicta]
MTSESGDAESGSQPSDASSTSHTRKHVCPHCAKRFNRPSSLRIHINTHTGTTPFRCPYPNCSRAFNVSSTMQLHYRNHSAAGAGPRSSTFSPCSSLDPDLSFREKTRRKAATPPPAVATSHSRRAHPYHLHIAHRLPRRSSTSKSPSLELLIALPRSDRPIHQPCSHFDWAPVLFVAPASPDYESCRDSFGYEESVARRRW